VNSEINQCLELFHWPLPTIKLVMESRGPVIVGAWAIMQFWLLFKPFELINDLLHESSWSSEDVAVLDIIRYMEGFSGGRPNEQWVGKADDFGIIWLSCWIDYKLWHFAMATLCTFCKDHCWTAPWRPLHRVRPSKIRLYCQLANLLNTSGMATWTCGIAMNSANLHGCYRCGFRHSWTWTWTWT